METHNIYKELGFTENLSLDFLHSPKNKGLRKLLF